MAPVVPSWDISSCIRGQPRESWCKRIRETIMNNLDHTKYIFGPDFSVGAVGLLKAAGHKRLDKIISNFLKQAFKIATSGAALKGLAGTIAKSAAIVSPCLYTSVAFVFSFLLDWLILYYYKSVNHFNHDGKKNEEIYNKKWRQSFKTNMSGMTIGSIAGIVLCLCTPWSCIVVALVSIGIGLVCKYGLDIWLNREKRRYYKALNTFKICGQDAHRKITKEELKECYEYELRRVGRNYRPGRGIACQTVQQFIKSFKIRNIEAAYETVKVYIDKRDTKIYEGAKYTTLADEMDEYMDSCCIIL